MQYLNYKNRTKTPNDPDRIQMEATPKKWALGFRVVDPD